MKTNILNPKIVLVEGSLGFEVTKRSFMDIETLMKQEKLYVKGIER